MWPTAKRRLSTGLVVEDDTDTREMIEQMLGMRGFNTLAATHAAQALLTCKLHQGTIDLLLVDVALPGVSGGEVARSACAVRPAMKVIYMSAMPRELALRRARLSSDVPFLAKPFTGDQLGGMIHTLLADTTTAARQSRAN